MSREYHPWLYRLAVATPFVAMLTLVSGALVTSKNAGMAFRDWPTSDGINMLTYPWLADFARSWDKFLEHGHRLAGIVIGCWSILLVVSAWRTPIRLWVKWSAVGVLLLVIVQGLLGGFRVTLDERGLAMVHGAFAAVVISWMTCLATFVSRNWLQPEGTARTSAPPRSPDQPNEFLWLFPMAWLCLLFIGLQYLLGGMIRHHGTALFEHLGMGIAVLLLVVVNTVLCQRARFRWLRTSAWILQLLVLGQVLLGGATWILKFGWIQMGYVAVADSVPQVISRTSHMLLGVAVFASTVMHLVRVWRTLACERKAADATGSRIESPASQPWQTTYGGAT